MNTIQKLETILNTKRIPNEELAERTTLYTTACLMLERYGVKSDTFFKELERLRGVYNLKHFGIPSIRYHKDRTKEVMQREKKLTIAILEHYINKKEYEI